MEKTVIRTLLVVGEHHEDIVKLYSLDTKVEPYIKYKYSDAKEIREKHLLALDKSIKTMRDSSTDKLEVLVELYEHIKEMSLDDYFKYISSGCTYNLETGDAYTVENPNAKYYGEKCYQKRLINENEEGYLSSPFPLIDGSVSYVAKKKDIDWDKIHNNEEAIRLYSYTWDVVTLFDNRENEDEWVEEVADKYDIDLERATNIFKHMKNRTDYFALFLDIDEYVKHNTSFWCYGVSFEDRCEMLEIYMSDKEWIKTFYDRYISDLSDDTVLSVYEICLI